jgi:hypothetical protein
VSKRAKRFKLTAFILRRKEWQTRLQKENCSFVFVLSLNLLVVEFALPFVDIEELCAKVA